MITEPPHLDRALSSRHIQLIAIGGAMRSALPLAGLTAR